MNNPNPFLPQGSLAEQKNQKRARLKKAVFSILGVNFALVAGVLLIQGCGNSKDAKTSEASPTGNPVPTDTSAALASNPSSSTNPPALVPPDTSNAPLIGGSNITTAGSGGSTSLPPTSPVTPPVISSTALTPVSVPASSPLTPVAAPVSVPAPAGTTTEYVVAKGDSFSTISKKVHVSSKAIMAANPGVVPQKLKVGQKLQIPAGGAPAMVASNTSASTDAKDSATTSDYVVKAHDTLTKIAHTHGITVKVLKAENHLKTDAIRVGDKLKLPAKAAPVSASADVTPMPIPSAPIVANSDVASTVVTH